MDAANRRFEATQSLLGMRGFRAPMGEGNNPTGCFVRESTFTIGPNAQRRLAGFATPPTYLVLGIPGTEADIHVGIFHGSFCSPPDRRRETFKLTRLIDKVKADQGPGHQPRTADQLANPPGDAQTKPAWAACWLLGDTNDLPEPDGELLPHPDWASPQITDRVHRTHRAERQNDRSWHSYTDTDEIMLNSGMHDAARWAAHHGQLTALAATAGHARPDQGGPVRIDRPYLDAYTVQAVKEVHVINMKGYSDHDLVVIDLWRRKLVEMLQRRTVEALPDWRERPYLPRVTTPDRRQSVASLARNTARPQAVS
ncbi:hypothetical protein [Streptomyces shenzhenensis]|uniref:hypothetical protein n=1 Tax=Streptomyces shenzhenensis TaxID=943815 RepID=UPI00340CB5E2